MTSRLVTALVVTLAAPPVGAEPPDFSRDIRPVLSDKCFLCHGPDESTRQADLRLDRFQDAVDAGAIVPGDPEWSAIIDRVTSDDPDVVMPPPETNKAVTPQEADALRSWIAGGAAYDTHWAFVPPRRPDVPAGIDGWGRNEIDAFVGERLQQHGLAPSPEADAATLRRRMSLDLVGLPPSIEELDALIAGNVSTDDAVDRLLASPHYGEKWGRWWLDAARYADSDGYEKDKPRNVWPYRDWVIDAFNADMPYDAFIVQQIAGDLLPDAGQNERVATGFLRNSMVNEEGGADPEQFRVEGLFDRIDAVGKSVLGITTQCAQCHTHKYDPLSHREYYAMLAALNDVHEATIAVYSPAERERAADIEAAVEAIRHRVRQTAGDWPQRLRQWEADVQHRQPRWTVMRPSDLPFEGQKFRLLEDGSVLSESYAPTKMNNVFPLSTDIRGITAVRLEALMHPQLPLGGPGRSVDGTGALSEFAVETTAADGTTATAEWAAAYADVNASETPLTAPYLEKDAASDDRTTGPIALAADGDVKTAWTTDIDPARRNRDHVAVFVPSSPVGPPGPEPYTIGFRMHMSHGGWNSDDNQTNLLGRYRFSVTTDPIDGPVPTLTPDIDAALQTPPDRRTPEQQTLLFDAWLRDTPEFAGDVAQIDALLKETPEGTTQLVVEAMERPRTTTVMLRGDFLSPGEIVEPGVPEVLGSLPDGDEPARLRFARWLVDEETPTPARVVVNRIWQSYFGRGLVETPEDFGMQSPPPSHPQLLDWLSRELVESGWSLKHIHRLILDSATYRQSSAVTDERLTADAYNVWLSRGPRLRVTAEVVRDSVLSAAGLLDTTVGGPSVYPPAPEFLFQPPASYGPKTWDVSDGHRQYRRSLYIHRFRSVLYPPLQAFDAPKADAACVRRERSNTPLQALVLLNEPQFAEAAAAMAGRVMRTKVGDTERLTLAHRLVTSRTPAREELTVLQRFLDAERQAGDERTAWTAVCRVLINLDETITKG